MRIQELEAVADCNASAETGTTLVLIRELEKGHTIMKAKCLLIICATACVLLIILVTFGLILPYRYDSAGVFPTRTNRVTGEFQICDVRRGGWVTDNAKTRLRIWVLLVPTALTVVVCVVSLSRSDGKQLAK